MYFEKLFGRRLFIRILQLLVENRDKAFSVSRVASLLNVNPGTASRAMNRLVERGLVEVIEVTSARVRRLYKLKDNAVTRKLIELHEALAQQFEEGSGL